MTWIMSKLRNSSSRRSFLAAGLAMPAAKLSSAPADPPLRYRVLGKTGLKLTEVGFGCMITSDPSVIAKALDLGINLYDTARVYQGGNNERMVGAALKGKRKQIILCSKSKGRTTEAALEDLNTSLRELQTDYLDVWYTHNVPDLANLTEGAMEAQRIAKKQGKIRFGGISLHSGHAEVIPAAIKTKHFDVLLVSYNFAMDKNAAAYIEQARKAGIGTVGMKVMAGGFRRAPFYPSDDSTRGTLKREGAMLAALKWVLKDKNIDTTIPSIVDMDELDENVQAMASPFSNKDEKLLAAQLDFIRPLYCRMCGSCQGSCPKGLPVSDMVRYLSYADGYGQFALGREHFLELPREIQQVRCGDCSSCSVQCPNGVRVQDRLTRAQELFA